MLVYGQLYCYGKFRKSPSWALKTSNAHSGCVVWAARPSSDAGSINALQQDQYRGSGRSYGRSANSCGCETWPQCFTTGTFLCYWQRSGPDGDLVQDTSLSRHHHTSHFYNQINLPLNISLTSLSHWKNKLALCAFRHGRNWHQSVDTI